LLFLLVFLGVYSAAALSLV